MGGDGDIHVETVSKAVSLILLEPSRTVTSLYVYCVPFYLPEDFNPPLLNSQDTLCSWNWKSIDMKPHL
jgi:hypothetical protein